MVLKHRIGILFQQLFENGWKKTILALWAGIGSYDLLGSQLLPEEWAKKMPRIWKFISETSGFLSLQTWLIILLTLVTIFSVEHTYRRSRKKNLELDSTKSFDIELSDRIFTIGNYECIYSITLHNTEQNDLKDCCLVKIEGFSGHLPPDMPIPFVLRTEGQIRGKRSGRFNLSSGEHKTIPILYRNPKRKNEWFLFDENGNRFFTPARPVELVLGIYGGKYNLKEKIDLDVGAEWTAIRKSSRSENEIKKGKFNIIGPVLEGHKVRNWPYDHYSSRSFINIEVKAEEAELINCRVYMTSGEKIDKARQTEIVANIPEPIELRWHDNLNKKSVTISEEVIATFPLLRTCKSAMETGARNFLCFCIQPGYPIDYPPTLENFFEMETDYRVGLRLTADNAVTVNFFIEFNLVALGHLNAKLYLT